MSFPQVPGHERVPLRPSGSFGRPRPHHSDLPDPIGGYSKIRHRNASRPTHQRQNAAKEVAADRPFRESECLRITDSRSKAT